MEAAHTGSDKRWFAKESICMSHSKSLPEDKKLVVTYRVEPGCLGPTGDTKIVGFCEFAQQEIAGLDADYVNWNIIPRSNKALPEMEYQVVGKRINHGQAAKYLSMVGKDLDEFEMHLSDKLADFIDRYMAR